ncbi:glycine zipper family protein [Sinimarinibacterium sp. NLF-5-8]|uniref:glycine zipper family protein n=1 Tax=Sinimarinibacterium sp. NLF-5-8 TaxID=2698684 RepID=UPI00137BD959|nr:glycine zipper family protein [Sinimarinibacterium sp. NLF-5-8]QHS09561.1 glycine zipper family protein [Sinimarinibacterium sp. NLF-5-8]
MKNPSFLIAAAVLAGCASRAPIVDTQGVDPLRYQQDLTQCQAYADQVNTAAKTGQTAVGGAALGAVIGAITGNSTTVARGAGVGGVIGGAKGASSGAQEKQTVVRNCLRGRGYRVLN